MIVCHQKLCQAHPKGLGIAPDTLAFHINTAVVDYPPTTFELNSAGDAIRRASSSASGASGNGSPSASPKAGRNRSPGGSSSGGSSSDFELVHLHEIRESIVSKYLAPSFAASGSGAASPALDDAMLTQVIHDWIVLWFLVGNDFLPHLPSITLDDGGTKKEFEGILKWHIESLRSDSRLTTGDTLNAPGLLSLFQKLAQDEAATFERYHKKHHAIMRFGDPSIPESRVDRVQLHKSGYSDR